MLGRHDVHHLVSVHALNALDTQIAFGFVVTEVIDFHPAGALRTMLPLDAVFVDDAGHGSQYFENVCAPRICTMGFVS